MVPVDVPPIWLPAKPAIIRSTLETAAQKRTVRHEASRAILFFAPPFFYPPTPKATYVGAATPSVATATTFTFVGVNIGTGASYLVLSILSDATVARTVTGVTVGGIAATLLIASPSGNNPCALVGIAVAAGGTATIVVTMSGNSLGCAVDVWALTGLISTTPTGTITAQASNPSASITPLAGGIVIAAAISGANTSCTWTGGVTERSDYTVAASNTFNATTADLSKAAGTALTPQATFGSNTTSRILLASFR